MPATHPSPELLSAFLHGKLTGDGHASVEEHVSGCDECCRKLSSVNDDTFGLLARDAVAQTRLLANDDSVPDKPPPAATVADIPPELRNHSKYRVLRVLGVGGMGTVYQARHRVMDRTVALKVIAPRLMADKRALARFEREVRAAAKLSHKHIVTAHDAETAGGLHFLVMEYVEGCSLAKYVLDRGPMAVGQACMCAKQTADGLQHAHERGMIHRDIKPHNLMLTKKDGVKILDFGLARFVQDEAADHSLSGSQRKPGLTMAGSVLGTPDFIAPEQVRDARSADIRADVYSLGCTLYFLLSGRPPFGGDLYDKLQSHREVTPLSLSTLREDLPHDLVEVIEKMMAKDPADRYQTPKEAAEALKPFCRRESPAPVRPRDVLPEIQPTEEWRPRSRRGVRKVGALPWQRFLPLAVMGTVALVLLILVGPYLLPAGSGQEGAAEKEQSPALTAGRTAEQAVEASVSARAPNPPRPVWTKPSRVLFVVPQVFWADDYYPVAEQLAARKLDVKVASSVRVAQSQSRSPEVNELKVGALLKEVAHMPFDAVLFCGAPGMNEFETTHAEDARRIVRRVRENGGIVGSICRGTRVLAAIGALDGRNARHHKELLHPGETDHWPNVRWTDNGPDVLPDGQLITARDATEERIGVEFANAVADALQK